MEELMLDYSELDPGVIPLVKYFNNQGLKTKMSCEGHDNPYMSLFWIEFDRTVTKRDINDWMKQHLNKMGNFCSCGHFVQRFLIVDCEEETVYRYVAANKEAAMIDFENWSEDDEEL